MAIDVVGPWGGRVARVVEGTLGWPVVAVDDPVLPARFVLTDVDRAAAHVGGPVPVLLLVQREDDPVVAARAARHALAVVEGVPDAPALQRVAERAAGHGMAAQAAWCTVAAAAGGVGATTVATALAGLRAWRVGPTLAAVRGPTHQDGAPLVAAADLAGPAVWAAARPVVGLDDCRVVGLRGDDQPGALGTTATVLEVEPGTGPIDVLVARPDAPGLAAAAEPAATVVLVGRGPLDPARFREVVGGRRVVALPWSARVGAAAAAGRLPADVPGTWLRPLVAVVDELESRWRVP